MQHFHAGQSTRKLIHIARKTTENLELLKEVNKSNCILDNNQICTAQFFKLNMCIYQLSHLQMNNKLIEPFQIHRAKCYIDTSYKVIISAITIHIHATEHPTNLKRIHIFQLYHISYKTVISTQIPKSARFASPFSPPIVAFYTLQINIHQSKHSAIVMPKIHIVLYHLL